MGRITTDIGLVSGINKRDIIDQLMQLESRPKTVLQDRIESTNERKLAYVDLSARLTTLKLTGTRLKKPSTFEAAAASSSNEDVLTATAGVGAAIGSFQFQVARLVTSQQLVSKGFSDSDKARVGAGTITIEQGGGELSSQTTLSQLNGGAGVRRGMFRITDRGGNTGVIDTTAAVGVDDVIKKINTSLDISVRASVDGDRIVLTDVSGKTANDLSVMDLGDGHAAEDLGLLSDSNGSAGIITGADVNYLSNLTAINQINDGRGIRRAATGADFTLSFRDGSTASVTLGPDMKTVGEVIDKINAASPTKVRAEIAAGTNNIKLTDLTAGGASFSVTAVGTSKAAADLGIEATAGGSVINGEPVLAGLNTTLLSSLNGGQGIDLDSLTITDRDGNQAIIDLSGAKTVQDVLDAISDETGIAVTARLKQSGNGIQIVDDSGGGGGDIVIADDATSQALGLNGTFDTSFTAVDGKNLQRQWISENTLLSTYNGGRGVSPGKFKVTNSTGISAKIDLTDGEALTAGDVINKINTAGIGVIASINANGDGLLLTDTEGGALKLKVENDGGTTATELNIAGTATAATIDGSFEKTIEITATDTLAEVQKKINELSYGVSANIINDGSTGTPFRLSLNARNTGRAGRVTFDAGTTTLGTAALVEAQDAAVFVGGADAPQPLLITSSTNQLTGVVKGVTIDLHGVSAGPVTLNVTRSVDSVVEQMTAFTEGFNEMVDKIKELTKFDTETRERGLLLGDLSIQKVEAEIYAMLQSVVAAGGKYRILADVGMRIGEGGKLEFDEEKFKAAYADDPDAVKQLFTAPEQGISTRTLLDQMNDGRGVRTAAAGSDFSVTLADGSTINVALSDVDTLGSVINVINAAGGTKLSAELLTNGSLKLTDLTTGAGSLALSALNGSQALADLGLTTAASEGVITGTKLGAVTVTGSSGGGIGAAIEARIAKLIDPVAGVITRESRTLDERTRQFQGRIDNLDKVLTSKRERLERQFAQLESVLSSLQNQQQAIGQIQTIRMPEKAA